MRDIEISDGIKIEAPVLLSAAGATEVASSSDLEKRLAEIDRDLRAAHMSHLQRAKLVRDFADTLELKDFRHDVGKRRGRPPGLVQLMADRLKDAIPGSSPEAKKKWIERALKIAALPESVIAAAKDAGLADSQSQLLVIAKEDGAKAQLKKIDTIREAKKEKKQKVKKRNENAKLMRGKKTALIVFPPEREAELVQKLIAFVEAEDVEFIPPASS